MTKLGLIIIAALLVNGCLSVFDLKGSYREHLRAADQAYYKHDYEEAEKQYKVALANMAKSGASESEVIITLRSLAQVYFFTRRDAEAESIFRQRIEMGEKTWAKNPGLLGTVYDDLATFYIFRKRFEEAKPIYERAIAVREIGFGPTDPEVVERLEYYATLLETTPQAREADELDARANAIKAQLKK